jgi:prolyl-tRNA editing enzyme YbaK/EbsC (Cys-tRNA(Pro) deacylase)
MGKTILDLPRAHINGGKRGFLLGIDPADIAQLLAPQLVAASALLHSSS